MADSLKLRRLVTHLQGVDVRIAIFANFRRKKLAFFTKKNNVMINVLEKLAIHSSSKKRQFKSKN
jgi:hypothetical protein